MAGNVTTEQAEQIATQFLNKHRMTVSNKSMKMVKQQSLNLKMATDANAYYIFNVGNNEGFVMVSGSDLAPQVLAYSNKGSFNQNSVPVNMQAWLQGYADQIAYLEQTGGKFEAPRHQIQRSVVSPLLTSTWNQGTPYNNMCPEDPNTGVRTVTGCVATALAQVINYHKYPSQTIAPIPSYTTSTNSISMPEIGITTIDWDNMLDNYDGSASVEQNNAVAQLMLLCGQAVEMNYDISANGGSGAYTAMDAKALQKYFGYDKTSRALERNAFGTTEWESLIYDELAANRPVLYGGQSTGGGHSFVIDGYNDDGLFHVNWGWGGNSDGYFLLSVLNPYNNSAIGSSSSNDGFSFSQQAIVGVQHDTDEVIPERFTIYGITNTGSTSYTRSSATSNFTGISIQLKGYNMTGDTHNFALNLALMDADNNVITTIATDVEAEKDYFYGWGALSFSDCAFGAELTDGDYYIVPVSKTENSSEWESCWRSDVYRIKAAINGNTLTLTEPSVNLSATIQATGNTKLMETLPLTAQITNNGSYFNDYVYIAVDGYVKGGHMFEAEAGETVNFDIDFVPTTAGNKSLLLAYKKDNSWVVFASGEVTVTGDLECIVNVTNANNGVVEDDKVTATVNITNIADDYDNDILLRLFKYDASSSSYNYVDIQYQHLSLVSGETTTLNFEFSGLENEKQYLLSLMYYKAGNLIQDADATFTTRILQDGDLFTARTEENVSMTFKVISAAEKTCQVGAGGGYQTSIIGADASYSSNSYPYDNYYNYSTVQMLYTPEEVGQAGKISKIAFKVVAASSCATSSVNIYMGHKASTFSGVNDYVSYSNLTLVYSGSPTLGQSTGWETLTLNQNTFNYNGTDNLVVVVTKACSSYVSGLKYSYFTGSGYTLYRHNDNTSAYANVSNTSYSYTTSTCRPSVQFVMELLPESVPTTTRGIVTIPAIANGYTVKSIGEKAFNNCTNIAGVKIPNSVTSIQANAFNGCTGLMGITTKIRFPFTVATSVFSSVSNNATLYVPYGSKPRYESVSGWNLFTEIVEMEPEDGDVFVTKTIENVDMTFKVASVSNRTCLVTAGDETTSIHVPTIASNTQDFITIPEETNGFSVTGIEAYAFYGCNTLAAVSIPNGVAEIGNNAFDGCSDLLSVSIEVENPVSINESVFPNRANAILYVPAGCVSVYEKAEYWKDFKTIKEMPDKVNNAIDLVDLIGCRGGQMTLNIGMKNIEEIVGFQFDLLLPDGITIVQDDEGKYMASLTNRKDNHLLSINRIDDNLYRFVSISMTNKSFTGLDGDILNVKLKSDENVSLSNTYEIVVRDTELTTADKDIINSVQNVGIITLKDAEQGDVNGDFRVSVTDVVWIISDILDETPFSFIRYAADLNNDKKVSVTDAVIAIDIILNEDTSTGSRVMKETMCEPQ